MESAARYRAVLGITFATFVLEIAGSVHTHSHGLFSDALHLLGDGVPFALGWYCVSHVLPEDVEENLETLIGYLNGATLLLMAGYIGGQGIYRLYHPVPVDKDMLVFAVVGLVGNFAQLYAAWGLRHAHQHASTFIGQILHLAMDVLSSVAVLIGAYLVVRTGNSYMDTYASLTVAAITLWAAWHCFSDAHFEQGTDHTHGHDHSHAYCGQGHHH